MKTTERKPPLTRFGEFELLKALAILGLPAVHLIESALESNYASPGLTNFSSAIIGLCVFGPSVFMICMGFGLGGSRTSAVKTRQAGIQFLLIGALLNLIRWLLPGIICAAVVHTNLLNDIMFCLASDIYYFVGIYYIFYSFMKQWNVGTPALLMISILMLTVNTILTPFTHAHITDPIVSALVGNIVYVDETSCFPLLSWAIFPSVGILLGEILKKTDEEQRERFMRRILDFSFVLFISLIVFFKAYDINLLKVLVSPANEYITDLPNVLILLSLALFLIGLAYYLCKIIGGSGFMKFVLRISAFIIPFYLLQWVLIAWIFYGMDLFRAPHGCFTVGWYILCLIAVTGLCILVTLKYGMKIMKWLLKITSFKKKKRKKKKDDKA